MSSDFDSIAKTVMDALQTDIAIIDKYGFVLASSIPFFKKDTVISPTLLGFINSHEKVAKELRTDRIDSFVLSIRDKNFVIVYANKLILMAQLPSKINLAEFLPSIRRFVNLLDEEMAEFKVPEFKTIDVSTELNEIREKMEEITRSRENKYKIFGEIVKHLAKIK